jgi:hypothetical protein
MEKARQNALEMAKKEDAPKSKEVTHGPEASRLNHPEFLIL